jgi:hypothetical protein
MTTKSKAQKLSIPQSLSLPLPQGSDQYARYLITAVLVAGKDGCTCESCQLLKKFGGVLGEAMLKEESPSGT